MLRITYDVVKPILSFHVSTEAEKYFQTPCSGMLASWDGRASTALASRQTHAPYLLYQYHQGLVDILIFLGHGSQGHTIWIFRDPGEHIAYDIFIC